MWEVNVQGFNFALSALHVCIFQSFFSISCCKYISKKIFYKFLLCVKVIQHRNAFLMWFVMWFFIFLGRAETVHDNHQCSYWEHLVHIYAIFQYSIILEIVICSSSVTLFVSWFHYSFVLSICINVDEKHFCQICTSSNMSKKLHTQESAHFMWFFYVICVSNLYFSVLVQTTEKCIFDVICHVIFCMFLVQLKPCSIITSVISDKICST